MIVRGVRRSQRDARVRHSGWAVPLYLRGRLLRWVVGRGMLHRN